jgi:hypothetical protein
LILGFLSSQVQDMDEAIAWVRRALDPMPGRMSEMEIRPFLQAADLADFPAPRGACRRRP